MSNLIKFETYGEEIYVAIPYELKDAFKASFKTSKWYPTGKKWIINVKSLKKLESWIAKIESDTELVEKIELMDTEVLSIKELEELEENIRIAKQKIGDETRELTKTRKTIEEKMETLEALSDLKKELEDLKAENETEKNKEKIAKEEIENFLKGAINLAYVLDAQKTMIYNAKGILKEHKQKFWNAQAEIEVERKKLKELGLKSKGIDFLVNINFNRTDRDHPRDVSYGDILKIEKIETEE